MTENKGATMNENHIHFYIAVVTKTVNDLDASGSSKQTQEYTLFCQNCGESKPLK